MSLITPTTRKKSKQKEGKDENGIEIDLTIKCFVCKITFKISEVSISEEEYNFMNENHIPGYVWLCNTCLKEPKQLTAFENKINKKLDKIQKQIETNDTKKNGLEKYIETKLQKLEEKFCSKVDKQKEALNQNIKTYANVVSNENEKNITSLNKEFKFLKSNIENNLNLEKERNIKKSKENNIILYNIPESEGTEIEAYKEDVIKIKTIFLNKLNLLKEDVKEIRRIGREVVENKIRPIQVVFTNLEKRSEALKLRNIIYKKQNSEEEFKIYISIDRTKQEQAQHEKLVQKLKEMKEEGKKNLYIRNGKIVTIMPFRPDPQQYWG